MGDSQCETDLFAIGDASALSAYCLLYYDYFLTLPAEVDRFWRTGSYTWASAVFLANRYAALLGHVPFLYRVFGDRCKTAPIAPYIATYHGILMVFLHLLTTILLVMRVYALYLRNKWVLGLLAFEASIGLFIGCVSVFLGGQVACMPISAVGSRSTQTRRSCHTLSGKFSLASGGVLRPPGLRFHRLCSYLMSFDKTVDAQSAICRQALHRWLFVLWVCGGYLRVPLIELPTSVIWNLNVVNIIALMVIPPSVYLSTPVFTNVLSVIMVSRLMINLRDPTLYGTNSTSHAGYVSTFLPGGTLSAIPPTQAELSIELGTLDRQQGNTRETVPPSVT